MADWLANTCEGTSGTAVSAVNSAGPNQFNVAGTTGAGTTQAWDNAQAHTGTTSLKNSLIASVASTAAVDWTTAISPTPVANAFIRFYVYMTAYPTVTTRLHSFIGSAANQCALQVTTTGTIRTVNQAGGVSATSTAVIPLSAWCRIEVDCSANTGTTATLAGRMFSAANLESSTPDVNGSLSTAGVTTTAQVSDARIGQSSSVTMTTTWNIWYDDIAFSDTSSPGPSIRVPLVIAAPALAPAVPLIIPGQVIGALPPSAGTAVTAGAALATGTALNPSAAAGAGASAAVLQTPLPNLAGYGVASYIVTTQPAVPNLMITTGIAAGAGNAANPATQATALPATAAGTGIACLPGWGPGAAGAAGSGAGLTPAPVISAAAGLAEAIATAQDAVASGRVPDVKGSSIPGGVAGQAAIASVAGPPGSATVGQPEQSQPGSVA